MSEEIFGLDHDDHKMNYIKIAFDEFPDIIHIIEIGDLPLKFSCNLIADMIKNDSTILNNNDNICKIPIPDKRYINQTSESFNFIKDYINIYNRIDEIKAPPMPISKEIIDSWHSDTNENNLFKKFIPNDLENIEECKIIFNKLASITILCNYFSMNELLHKSCALIAYIIKGKTPEEIKKICN